jgi:hypothetical protein
MPSVRSLLLELWLRYSDHTILGARATWTVGPTSWCFRACRASAETEVCSVQILPHQHSIGFPICFSIPALLVNRQAADRLKTDEPQCVEAQDYLLDTPAAT